MATNEENAAIVNQWFNAVWAGSDSLTAIDRLSSPDIIFQYAMNGPLRGRVAVKMFAKKFRDAFPDIVFKTIGELRAREDLVVYRWEGAGTHTGPAFNDFLIGPLPEASGKKIKLSGFTIVKLVDGKIIEEAVWSKERQAERDRVDRWFL